MFKFVSQIFGTRNQRLLKRMKKLVQKINALESGFQQLNDGELGAKTLEFKQRLASGETLDSLLPEAFAAVREASRRTLQLRHFDVQLIGGMVLHAGKIAEMRTGEGKTLMATLAAYLNALAGKGVYIVTVNDYLAKRDAEWMRPIYEFLGLTIGINLTNMDSQQKKQAYAADITYGTNNEFGFDYLRDNMAFGTEGRVQRSLYYAIVDEVDSILIDESRTPLIISGAAEQSSDLYLKMNAIVPKLAKQTEENQPGDYTLDEKLRQVYLTEQGHQRVEQLLEESGILTQGKSLYDVTNVTLMHHLYAALRAHTLYHRDVDYIVKDGQVIIVDEHTGRLTPGRRWSDGLHQATEAKEGVLIRSENQTLASITFQNYFRLFEKLAGMTGTADTEAYEFQQIYGLEVVVIPTNKPVKRLDLPDQVYLTRQAKFDAIVTNIKKRTANGQPILVGTASIETSELLSNRLKQEHIVHQVLNAKFHEQEAKIIAEAGRPAAVTIATNMAGRGTDIVLGGNLQAELNELSEISDELLQEHQAAWQKRQDQVIAAGGLHVLGTERNESRRIDNQLRGRSGRQGDPGSSQFYLSMEDNLMRIFAPERMTSLMRRLGMKEDEVIENPLITRAIENAQRKVEGQNFDIRKQLLEFDDVANDQRKVIYNQRNELMELSDISGTIDEIRAEVFEQVAEEFIPLQSMEEQWDVQGLQRQLEREFGISVDLVAWLAQDEQIHEEMLRQRVIDEAHRFYQEKEKKLGTEVLRSLEKSIMLQSLDTHWREHLGAMDHLRRGIHLRGYAQKNPKQEYKREAFLMFTRLLEAIRRDVIATLCRIQTISSEDATAWIEQERRKEPEIQNMQFVHAQANAMQSDKKIDSLALSEEDTTELTREKDTYIRAQPKIGRNTICHCGSGKKYKHCHGALEQKNNG